PTIANKFKAQIVVMQHPSVITAGYTPVFHAHTAQVACTIESINQKLDPASGEVKEENPDFIKAGDAAIVTVRPQKPLCIEAASEFPQLGSFAIRDMGQTVAAGKVLEVEERE
ncbi:MAG: elongation factor 1-alpha, partial [Halobacteria archaeon]|nr:elongation factor 1-alpha [Halobacteria archaeon]